MSRPIDDAVVARRDVLQQCTDKSPHSLHVWPLLWVSTPAFCYHVFNDGRPTVVGWNMRSSVLLAYPHKVVLDGIIWVENLHGHYFPQKHTERENIGLLVVWLLQSNLRSHLTKTVQKSERCCRIVPKTITSATPMFLHLHREWIQCKPRGCIHTHHLSPSTYHPEIS